MCRATRNIIFLLLLALSLQCFSAAPSTENKPTVLVVYADWCPYCQKLKPTLALINEKYHGKIRFIRFDLTSEETVAQSKQQAQSLGFADFFAKNEETTALVVINDASGHEVFRAVHDYDPQHYQAVLDKLLSAERK